jgi:isoleucyl-tRNA synthetase
MALFRAVSSQVSFPELEGRILERWRERDVFARSLALRRGAEEFVMYEGPPTANAKPGVHHVEARAFKDIYPRFRTMRGFYVDRRGGWDCHGLPVEIEVERELGLTSKRDIEAFGIEQFNERCRQSVRRYVEEWERLTERIGYWTDLAQAYWTMSNPYVESVWWSLSQLFEKGLLSEDLKSVPYCPRCGTPLSDHEVAQGYTTVTDPSVYVRFPLEGDEATSLLVWTTTPWTLPSNAAAAIHPEVQYVAVAVGGERLIVAEPLVHRIFGPDAKPVEWFDAGSLEGRHYRPPFRFVEPSEEAWYVISAEFVTTEDGTGVVHIAPAFGAEDLEMGRQFGLPFIQLVNEEGNFTPETADYAGRFVKDADADLVRDLDRRGLLFRSETVEHTYPLCWRCRTPLLYYAKTSWFIRTRSRKDDLLAANETVRWHPDHIKHGRFGDWLANNVDWALSRSRYWGTPLPIWRCASGHVAVVGSIAELSERAGRDLSGIDLHRPFVDHVTFACPECAQEMRRVPEVIDAWYDSGAMPFAQWHYPFENADAFKRRLPADYIAEALDQTRGWFYTLLAESALLFGPAPYRNVVCLGLLVDQDGRKMSKSLGNVIDPWEVIDGQGADALRWFMFTSGSPWASRRIGPAIIEDIVRGFMRMLWNVYSFYVLYANTDDLDPTTAEVPPSDRPEMDRWILAELHDALRTVTAGLEAFDSTAAGRRIAQLVDDLSNWYVRRSRRRFWKEAGDRDKASAHLTLHECLATLALMLAPFTPFLADEIWTNLVCAVRADAPDSVHLADWPSADERLIDEELRAKMATARAAVRLGLQARDEAKVKVRQPLARAVVAGTTVAPELLSIVADELNVKQVVAGEIPDGYAAATDAGLTVGLDLALTPQLRAEGMARELVRGVQNLRKRSGLEVADRIHLWVESPDEIWNALAPFMDWLRAEVLATDVFRGRAQEAAGEAEVRLGSGTARVSLART